MTRQEQIRQAASRGMRGPSARGEISVQCPFCLDRVGKEDQSYKLQLNQNAYNKNTGETGPFFHCYRCGAAGSCDLSWLGDVELPPEDPSQAKEWQHPPQHFEVLTESSITLRPYVQYLKNRRCWPAAKHLGVGACLAGKYAGRVILPCKNAKGQYWGFSARTVVKPPSWSGFESPRYLYPKGMPRATSLWGADWIPGLKDKDHPLYLTEGCFDAIALYPYGLAAFGKNVTEAQIGLLMGLKRRIVVALDGDAAQDGRILTRRLQARDVDAVWCKLPPCTDPGTLGWEIEKHLVTE